MLWERDGLTQRELSVRAGIMDATTFAALRTMEKRGYVSRYRKFGDNKRVFIYLTEAGKALKPQLVPIAEETNRVAVQGIPEDDLVTTRRTLARMFANLRTEHAGDEAA